MKVLAIGTAGISAMVGLAKSAASPKTRPDDGSDYRTRDPGRGLLATLGPTAIWSEPIMANIEQHRAVLQELNRNFVRSVDEANVAWFDANLAADFLNTTPDGSLIDRKAFLAQIGRGSTDKNIREHDVMIRILGDFAIIHARTTYMNPDGTQGSGRYTDDYQFRDGRWQCVSAHYTRA